MRAAKIAFAEREVEINKDQLVKQLITNREKHVKEYNEAMEGYKLEFKARLENAYNKAKTFLDENYKKLLGEVEKYTDDDIVKQSDSITLVNSIQVKMPVPKSYEKEYILAIELFQWEVKESVRLTSAEFNCFVRDEWDWKENFTEVMSFYKKA